MDHAPRRPGLRVGFDLGVTTDRWARAWREQMPRTPLDLVPLGSDDGLGLLRAGELRMGLLRLPLPGPDVGDLHQVRLYDEQPVVLVSAEHPVAVFDRVDVTDLAEEHRLEDADAGAEAAWRDPALVRQAVERVAADAGVLVVPMSLARLHRRRDVVSVPLDGAPVSTVALVWLREADDDLTQAFVGVVRGRTANTSRGPSRPGGKPQRGRG